MNTFVIGLVFGIALCSYSNYTITEQNSKCDTINEQVSYPTGTFEHEVKRTE